MLNSRTLIVVAVLMGQGSVPAASDEHTVLVLYSDPSLVPATAALTEGLRAGTQSAGVQLESQYLDISRFTADIDEPAFAQWLQARYRDREIPVVVPVGVPASVFATRFAGTIWPRARLVHAGVDGEQLDAIVGRGDPVAERVLDYRSTVEAAMALLPEVRQLTLISGASDADRRWLQLAESNLAPLRDRLLIKRLAGRRWGEVLDQVAHLPEDAIAIPVSFFADAENRTFVNADAAMEIAQISNRPVFVTSEAWVGSGAVGGFVMDPAGLGRQTARLVRAVLAHQDPSTVPRGEIGARWLFDAVQLRRWGIAERDLPAGSAVVNRMPSFWSQYGWYAASALALIVLQSLLIGGLLLQRTRRRRAESEARASETALRVSYERIRQLAGRLIGAQESARTRIARDLHDDVCQELAGVSMAVGDVKERSGDIRSTETQHALSVLHRRTLDLVKNLRRLSHDLHPSTLRHVGLAAALEAHCIEVEQRYDVQVSFHTDEDLRALPGDAAVALFRISQEALRNAATHGGARRVSLSIARNGESIDLVVTDDGAGFDPGTSKRSEGLGLVSMEERARLVGGTLSVWSAPGAGTTIRATVPCGASPTMARDALAEPARRSAP